MAFDLAIWRPRFEVVQAVSATCAAIGIVAGGLFALFQYYHQIETENALRRQELALAMFTIRKDTYFELADAAAAIANSSSAEVAAPNILRFNTAYDGRSHAFDLDPEVRNAKILFHRAMDSATFPSTGLKACAQLLDDAIHQALHFEAAFPSESASAPSRAAAESESGASCKIGSDDQESKRINGAASAARSQR